MLHAALMLAAQQSVSSASTKIRAWALPRWMSCWFCSTSTAATPCACSRPVLTRSPVDNAAQAGGVPLSELQADLGHVFLYLLELATQKLTLLTSIPRPRGAAKPALPVARPSQTATQGGRGDLPETGMDITNKPQATTIAWTAASPPSTCPQNPRTRDPDRRSDGARDQHHRADSGAGRARRAALHRYPLGAGRQVISEVAEGKVWYRSRRRW